MPFEKGHQHWKKRKDLQNIPATDIPSEVIEEAEVIAIPITQIVRKPILHPNAMIDQIRELRNSVNRHAIGLEKALQDYQDQVAQPVCPKCYVHRGWLTKCACITETY